MSYEFNADEVFEIAERIERNGARFYRRAAELSSAEEREDLRAELTELLGGGTTPPPHAKEEGAS